MCKDGRRPGDDVYDEMKRMQAQNKYLSTKFWADLDAKWEFSHTNVYDLVPEPCTEEALDPELGEAILQAQDPNPPARTAARFEKYLEYATNMNDTEFFGALQGCKPSINLSPAHAFDMEVALLDFIVDKSLGVKFPRMWDVVKDHYEMVMKQRWRNESATGRSNFITQNASGVARFMDISAVATIEERLKSKRGPPLCELQLCLKRARLEQTDQEQATNFQRLRSIDAAKRGARGCLDHPFDAVEAAIFNNMMQREVER